jgi:hypothetical protein
VKNLKSVLVGFILVLSGSGYLYCQPKAFNLTTRIQFFTMTDPSEIKLPVFPLGPLNLKITSTLFAGDLTIEFYDPKGEKQGNFSIANQAILQKPDSIKRPLNETVRGEITRNFENPGKGEWVVKLIPKNASGFLEINSVQDAK